MVESDGGGSRRWRLLDLDVALPPGEASCAHRVLLAERPHDLGVPYVQLAGDGFDGVPGGVRSRIRSASSCANTAHISNMAWPVLVEVSRLSRRETSWTPQQAAGP